MLSKTTFNDGVNVTIHNLNTSLLPAKEAESLVNSYIVAVQLNRLARIRSSDYKLVRNMIKGQNTRFHQCGNAIETLHFLKNEIREQSNGAVRASVFYMSPRTSLGLWPENNFKKPLIGVNVLYLGIQVIVTDDIKDNVVWCLGESRFNVTEPRMLFIGGMINESI